MRTTLLVALLTASSAVAADGPIIPFLFADLNKHTTAANYFFNSFGYPEESSDYYFYQSGLWHSDGTDIGTYLLDPDGRLNYRTRARGLNYYESGIPQAPGRLMATDGTTSGTRSLMDLAPGYEEHFFGAGECGQTVCLSLDHNRLGTTDGTRAGTSIVPVSTPQIEAASFQPANLSSNGKIAVFRGSDALLGSCEDGFSTGIGRDLVRTCGEPWLSDGTASGTHLLRDLIPGPSPSGPSNFYGWKGKVYFSAWDTPLRGRQAFATDGTAQGTLKLSSAGLYPASFVGLGDYVYYFSYVEQQWWRTDGTAAGTHPLRALMPLDDGIAFTYAAARDGRVLAPILGRGKSELWFYDGRRGVRLFDNPMNRLIDALGYLDSTRSFYYLLQDANSYRVLGLYATDGTDAGTLITKLSGYYGVSWWSNGKTGIFMVGQPEGDMQLWQTDGTASGTHLVPTHQRLGESSSPRSLTSYHDRLYFSASVNGEVRTLFVSDAQGPPAALYECKNTGRCGSIQVVDDRIYFFLDGPEVYTFDDAGKLAPLSTALGLPSKALSFSTRFRGADYALTGSGGNVTLWAHDTHGTRSTTTAHIDPNLVTPLVASATRIFFGAGQDLIVSDGNSATIIGSAGSPQNLVAVSGGAFFQIGDALWFSDGTIGGTKPVTGAPRSIAFKAPFPIVWHDQLFFSAAGEVWRSDGTAAGTVKLPRPAAGEIRYAADLGDRLAIIGHQSNVMDVWTTDGTAAGTFQTLRLPAAAILDPVRDARGEVYLPVLLFVSLNNDITQTFINLKTGDRKDLPRYAVPTFTGQPFISVRGRLFFANSEPQAGEELWALDLDGTPRRPLPSVSIEFSGMIVVEGKRAAVFTATIDGASAIPPSVGYQTVDGSLRGNRDYASTSGRVTFRPSDTTRAIVITVADDVSGDFGIALAAPENATISGASGTATVTHQGPRRRPIAH